MAFNRSTFVIYDEEFNTGMVEEIQQAAVSLNEAAGGVMSLSTQKMRGEFLKETFYKQITGLVRDRDPNDLTASTADDLTMGEEVGVKVHKSIHVEKALNAFEALGDDAREFSFLIGVQFSKAVLTDYLNSGIAAAVGALMSEASVQYDATAVAGKETISPANLNRIKKRLGDQGQRIRAWVMNSTLAYDLVEENIESKITNIADLAVAQGTFASLSIPVIITDSPFLTVDNGVDPDDHYVLALTEDAVQAVESEDRNVLAEVVGGGKNLIGRIQSEFALTVGVAGAAYNGVAKPTKAMLADPANWAFVVTDVKSGPGAIGIFNAIAE